MKFIKRVMALFLITFFLASYPQQIMALSEVTEDSPQTVTTMEEVQTFAYVIDWRYKIENGKCYKRQFNYTTGQWIGQWQLCS